ncbi:MAG: hypothetical protein E6713_02740 [Sporomusaceae bacterium]|nr:hypothetical protein [Sporomusaceae bacterium]
MFDFESQDDTQNSDNQEALFNSQTQRMWREMMIVRNIPECNSMLRKILPKLTIVGQKEFNEIINNTYKELMPYIINHSVRYSMDYSNKVHIEQ